MRRRAAQAPGVVGIDIAVNFTSLEHMAVVIEGFSVIIRRDAIQARFPGGWEAFSRQAPNATLCSDGQVVRVAFMHPRDIEAYVTSLENRGLIYLMGGRAIDMNVADQIRGTNFEDDWLTLGKVKIEGVEISIAWMGEPDGRLSVPEGWRPGALKYAPQADGDRLRFLRREGDIEVYENLLTGEEQFHGRTIVEGGGEASALGQLEGIFHEMLNLESKVEAARARRDRKVESGLLKKLRTDLLPGAVRWTREGEVQIPFAYLVAGLGHRILGERKVAEAFLKKGNEVAPGNLAFLRELVRVLGEQNRPEEALPYAREAVKVDTIDAGAWGNLAMCLIQCKKMDEAREALREALLLDPNDKLNARIRDHYFKGRL